MQLEEEAEEEESSALQIDEVLKFAYRQADLHRAFVGMSHELQERAESLNEKNLRTEQKSKDMSEQ